MSRQPPKTALPTTRPGWTQDPERVKRDILEMARQEFVEQGLSGARVDRIAAKTATSKRMIYYYFTDKQGLFQAVLEDTYARIRSLELALDLGALMPLDAIARLTGFTFDYHADDPALVRLVMVENIHRAAHLKASATISRVNSPAIAMVRDIYQRGVADGVFRPGLDPLTIHLTMSALSFYNVANHDSIQQVFGHDMAAPRARQRRRREVIETVVRFLKV